jgi:uncharacterized RDD family membrane protein YckC
MVKIHIARSLSALERIYGIRIAVADGEPTDGEELDRVRTFRKSVPPLFIGGVAMTSVFIGLASIALAAMKRLWDAVPLANWIHDAYIFVPESETSADKVTGAMIVISLALAVVVATPVGSFRFKRALFNTHPRLARAQGQATSEDMTRSVGAYTLERRVFARLNARPRRELPLDLTVSALTALALTAVIVNAAIATAQFAIESDLVGVWFMTEITALLVLFLVLAIARNIRAIHWRAGLKHAQPIVGSPASLGARWHAQLLDLPGVFALSVALWICEATVLGLKGDLAWGIAFAVPTLAAAAYAAACLAGLFHVHGPSYGKSRSTIAVLRSDGAPAEWWRLIIRDVLLKWGVFGPAAVLVLLIPTGLNLVWPFFDKRRRALHDVVAGTIVMQVEREHVLRATVTPT